MTSITLRTATNPVARAVVRCALLCALGATQRHRRRTACDGASGGLGSSKTGTLCE